MQLQSLFTTTTSRLTLPRLLILPHFGPEQCSFSLTQRYWSLRGIVCSQVYVNCSGCVIALLQHFWFLFQWWTYRLPLWVALVYCHYALVLLSAASYLVEVQHLVTAQNNTRSSRKVRSKDLVDEKERIFKCKKILENCSCMFLKPCFYRRYDGAVKLCFNQSAFGIVPLSPVTVRPHQPGLQKNQ